MVDSEARSNKRLLIPSAGEAFPDGTMLDLIRDGAEDGETKLLIWNRTTASIQSHFVRGDKEYIPVSAAPSVLRALRLPTCIAPCGSTRQLFVDLCRMLTQFNDLPEESVKKVAHFLFVDWLGDFVPVAPLLLVLAGPTAPGEALRRLLTLLCRRSLPLGDVSPARLRALPMYLKPTLLLDVPEINEPLRAWLRASNRQGMYVPGGGGVSDQCSAKVIFTQEPLDDPTLTGLSLQVAMTPTLRDLPLLDAHTCRQIAEEFQARMQMYRLTNWGKISTPKLNLGGLTAPTQDLARTLAAGVVGDEELQSEVIPLLRSQDQELRMERAAGLVVVIIEALLFCCHEGDMQAVRCSELADIVNTFLAGRGESVEVSAETIGWRLKALQLHTEPIGSQGKGVLLLNETRARIHQLAAEFGVRTVRSVSVSRCRHCSALE